MKKLLFALLIITGCNQEDPGPTTFCTYGKNPGGDWVFMRCATKEQYMMGSNVAQGGIAIHKLYMSHKIEACSQCQ